MSRGSWSKQPDPADEFALPGSRSAGDSRHPVRPGRHGLRADAVAADQCERIIDAFAHVVAERGYPQTTIKQITDAAGVSKKTFYVHFTDLEDCFLAAYEYSISSLLSRVRPAYQAESHWRDAIRAGLGALLEWLAVEPAFARMSVIETGSGGPRIRQARSRTVAEFEDVFAGHRTSSVPPTVRNAVSGGIYHTIYSYVAADRTTELPELVASLMYFALLPFIDKADAANELSR
ncbi:MAG: HTH-type transcriptional repressor Bm3R1 [Actinomycetia bacterium]|nr:HTH-type transcriptional repressor Bm3R1 [Actinomycetes bacterium]